MIDDVTRSSVAIIKQLCSHEREAGQNICHKLTTVVFNLDLYNKNSQLEQYKHITS